MQKERLTITLDKTLLSQVDQTIDGTTIRNRSHAIAALLHASLGTPINRAFILAGGQGVQLRPLTYELPPPMIPFHGKPLMEHTIELLKQHGITEVIVGIGYLGNKIKDHFKDGSQFGVNIRYTEEEKPLGTAGAIAHAQQLLEEEAFLVIHGDIIIDIDLNHFTTFAQEEDRVGVMALTSAQSPASYGVVTLKGNQVVAFNEKPTTKPLPSHLVSAGLYVFKSSIFAYLEDETSLEKDVFPKLIQANQLSGYNFAGPWFDISTNEVYEKALKTWKTTMNLEDKG